MKNKNVKNSFFTSVAIALAMSASSMAQTLYTGHWDIEPHYHENALEVALHNHDTGEEHELPGPQFHFGFGKSDGTGPAPKTNLLIGNNNYSVWISAHDGDAADLMNQPFIGFSAGDRWSGNVTFTLSSLHYTGSGAGNLFLFEGEDVFWNSLLTGANRGVFTVGEGQHAHGEFAFSDEGLYKLTLEVSGNYVATYTDNNSNNLFDSGDTILTTSSKSGTSTLDINVVPEPSTGVLLMAGLATLSAVRRRTRR
jgi:hypothetical protein